MLVKERNTMEVLMLGFAMVECGQVMVWREGFNPK